MSVPSFTLFFFQSAVISDEKAAEFRYKVYRAITLTHIAEYLLIALGGLCIVVAVVLLIIPTSRKQRFEMTIQARMKFISLCSTVTVFELFIWAWLFKERINLSSK